MTVTCSSYSWLFACASAQKIVPPDKFMVKVPLPEEPHPPSDQPDDHTPVLEERGEESELAKSFHPQYDVQVCVCTSYRDFAHYKPN